ncbi:MAG: AmmeMemoRadiSam system protein B [candidate division Zixibacteria bacterium]|nr:AmmeMemoRadiSam system protein B [candidate division Zixibacteria bacterium]
MTIAGLFLTLPADNKTKIIMQNSIDIRRPSAAGSFYPSNPVELSKLIARFYSEAQKESLPGYPLAIIVPHAGYIYSGKTAAAAYKQIEGESYETVVVIAPSHTIFFPGASVYDGDAYQTPIGMIEIDKDLSRAITSINPSIYLSNKGHTGGSVRGEHALEVQLPFLQQVLGKFKLVAIVMGDQEEPTCHALGEVLASVLGGKEALIVASTDLSHFHPEKEARQLDVNIQRAIEEYNSEKLLAWLSSGRGEACGGGPVAATLIASKKLGGEQVVITGYTTSAETTGDFSEVVGYLSAVIVSGKQIQKRNAVVGATVPKADEGLTEDDKSYLKKLAIDSIRAKLEGKTVPLETPSAKFLKEKRGAFVTLKIGGYLRGCIGLIRAMTPLYEVISEMACAAAFDDPRFESLDKGELEDIEIEISVLSPLIRVEDPQEIIIGRDGLMIIFSGHSGLLLPQVATENGWDRITFLEQTCLKAGLPKNSYKDKMAEIYCFTAEVF